MFCMLQTQIMFVSFETEQRQTEKHMTAFWYRQQHGEHNKQDNS